MRTLLLDTSTERGVVGLADGETLLHEHALPADRRHARDLIPAMKSACGAVGWRLRSVELLVVSAGPGSYTGLRVGIAAVKALVLTNDARIIALDSLEVVACQAGAASRISAIADAQQQRIYAALFRREDSGLPNRLTATALQSTEDWLTSLEEGDVVTGPAVSRWLTRIPTFCRIVEESGRPPKAESLLALSIRERNAGRFTDCHSLEPIYLRPSAAEERRPA